MSFQRVIEWLAQNFQRIEVILPILAGAAVLAFLGIRHVGKRRSSIAVEELGVVEEEAKHPAEKPLEIGDEFSEIRERTLEILRTRGALRPAPIAGKEGGHYPDIVGISLSKVEDFIEDLVKKGLALEGDVEFSAISCPLCGSSSQAALVSCKNCGSFKVHELRYYRHTCGYVGPESSFLSDGELVCPHCKSSEGMELYHKRYYCGDCRKDSEEVNITFKCGSCGSLYDESNMALKQFRRIELSRERLREYEGVNRELAAQLQRLRAEGYVIERPATMVGESGVVHSFDAVAKKGDEVIAIVSSLGKPLTQLLLELGIAKMDLKLSGLIVITGKPSSPTERDFAKSLGIEIIEATRT